MLNFGTVNVGMILKALSFSETIQAEGIERERPGHGASHIWGQGKDQHPREELRGSRNIRRGDNLVPREQRVPKRRCLTREQRFRAVAASRLGVHNEKNTAFLSPNLTTLWKFLNIIIQIL